MLSSKAAPLSPSRANTAESPHGKHRRPPVIKVLQAEIVRLRKRVESLEYHLREDHEKIEKLEHEHEHDHEVIERLEHHTPTSYYTGRRTVPVGL